MIWESTPQALYDTSILSALLSSRLLPREKRSLRAADAVKIHKSHKVVQEKTSEPSWLAARHSPEHTDELGGHELRAELLHFCHVAQEAQHVAVQLLLLWELLARQGTGLYTCRTLVMLRTSNPGKKLYSISRKAQYFWVVSNGSLAGAKWCYRDV